VDLQNLAADLVLELVRRALRDHRAQVDHGDPVGEVVGLLEVLRREQDRLALIDQLTDHRPEVHPAPRVEPGGRLVEEQHVGASDEAGCHVEPTTHPARVCLGLSVGGVGQAEPFQDLDGAPSGFPGREVVQPSHHLDVLETGQVLVDGRRLSGQPETAAEDLCVPNHVKPYDLGPAAVRQQQGRKDPDRSGLACPIWPKQPEDGTRRNIKIDAAQCFYGTEALDEPLDDDGSSHPDTLRVAADNDSRSAKGRKRREGERS
jgi:hypothetical protein